ncbi:mannitol dehydrogenase family protein [Sporanaerobacter sp. PP17-6a]|uniref:mannitol dehydrogenase family protein n=1 Tax=Sporanaerobacter sp. PP17-6a TaxID=1891289 RepID=UPI0008A08FEB|nr:hypothetical protein [Sporanaerobacter sp. PP17-6a]SCL94786.1 Mannitol-1-phosphate 5-dehydrogenase [Sporanaerobacter sp. PP17-6a]
MKAVIFGAGQTGRGYIARYLVDKNYDISFVEINRELISKLNEDKFFNIHFYDQDRTPFVVSGFNAYYLDDQVIPLISQADLIFTAVGEQNLKYVAPYIVSSLNFRKNKAIIITNENGINPARVLRDEIKKHTTQNNYLVSQTAVFCSTVNVKGTRLDIFSQNETYYPYDCDELTTGLNLKGAVPVHNFENFLKRKIYTYNALAGIISYLGYLKGYSIYGEAANDEEISYIMDLLLKELNPALAEYFNISLKEQETFANKALTKFKNRNILDYVIKNGRDAFRKLGKTERIIAPMKIIEDHGGNADILYLNAAAALTYWKELSGNGREPLMSGTPLQELAKILDTDEENELIKKIEAFYNKIIEDRDHIKLFRLLENNR